MATPAAILNVLVKLDSARAVAGMKQVDRQAAQTSSRVSGHSRKMSKAFGGVATSALKAGAGVAAAYASIAGAKKAISVTEELAKSTLTLHKSFGLTVESASQWAAISKARGTEGKALVMGFKALSTQTRNAREEISANTDALGKSTKAASAQVKVFEQLGISQQELAKHGDDLNWVLGAVADGLQKMPAGTDRAAISAKLFGRTWTTISPLVRGGSKALKEQLALADEYGVTLKGKTVEQLHELTKASRESKLATMGLQLAFGTAVAPVLTKVTLGVAHFVNSVRNGTGEGKKFQQAFIDMRGTVQPAVQWLLDAFTDLPKVLKIATAAAIGLGIALTISNPVIAGLMALVAAATLIRKNWGPISALFIKVRDAITNWTSNAKQDMSEFIGVLQTVARVARAVFEGYLLPVIRRILPAIKQTFEGAVQAIKGAVKIITGILTLDFGQAFDGVKQLFKGSVKAWLGQLRAFTAPARELAEKIGHAIVNGITGAMSGLGHAILRRLKDVGSFISNAWKSVAGGGVPFVPGIATGGWIRGRASAGDSVPALLQPGEVVLNSRQQAMVGKSAINGALRATGGKVVGMASGGIVALGKQLQREGYQVSENPAFGGVGGGHVKGSYHYKGAAIDVNGGPGGEPGSLDRLYKRLKGMAGVVELLWRVKGHYDHLHVAMAGGSGKIPGASEAARAKTQQPSKYELASARAELNVARTTGTTGAGHALRMQRHVVAGRIKKVSRALTKKGLSRATRLRLTQELTELTGTKAGITQSLADLKGAPYDAATAYGDVRSLIDARERAGIYSAAEAQQQRAYQANRFVTGGFGAASEMDVLSAMGDLKDAIDANTEATTQSNDDLIAVQKQIADNQQQIIALTTQQGPQILAAVIAAVSGGIGGKVGLGYQSIGVPGSVARY